MKPWLKYKDRTHHFSMDGVTTWSFPHSSNLFSDSVARLMLLFTLCCVVVAIVVFVRGRLEGVFATELFYDICDLVLIPHLKAAR